MKKVISIVAALALATAMATSAFAADTGYTKEQLKAKVAIQAQKYGVSADAANQVIDALTEEQAKALDVDVMQAAVEEAVATISGVNKQSDVAKAVDKAVDSLQKELARVGATVEVSNPEVVLNADGTVTAKATVSVNGAPVSVAGAGQAQAPWTDSSKNDTNNVTSGAAASTANVIKATGLNTTGAAVVALAVASVLGAAAVKARKLGE